MTQLTYSIPTVGQSDSTEEPLIPTALSAIKTTVNGNLDHDNLKAAAGVLLSQLETAASGKVPIGDGTKFVANSISGDATLASNGALTIANNAITNAKMADNSVGAAEIIDGSITTVEINALGIPTNKITRPTLQNDGSTGGLTGIGTGYTQSGATFTANQTGLHLIVTNGHIHTTVGSGNARFFYRLYVNGTGTGTETKATWVTIGSGFTDQYLPITQFELLALTSGDVVDFRVKCASAAVGDFEAANDIVIKAACLTL